MSDYRVKKDTAQDIWYLQRKIMNEHYKMQWIIIGNYSSLQEAEADKITKVV